MKRSRNVKSIAYVALGEGPGAEEGDAVKGSFTMPKRDGLFAKVRVWVYQVPPISDYGGLDLQALFCRVSD